MKLYLQRRQGLIFILILAAAVFLPLLSAPSLTWDDDSNIFSNPYFRQGQWSVFWTAPYFGIYVPLTTFVWEVLFSAGHGQVWPFRVLNLSLHLFNIGLVYILLQSLARRWKFESQLPLTFALALFAFHPMQVESVAWISGGRDLLAATFSLLAVLFYFRSRSKRAFAIATVFFAMAVLSKPNSVVLPLVILTLEFVLDPAHLMATFKRMLLWFALTLWPIWLTMQAQAEHLPSNPWASRPWIFLDSFTFYFQKFLKPWPQSANYNRTPEVVLSHPMWIGMAVAFGLLCTAGLMWSWRRDRRYLIAATWFILLLPVSGILPFGFQKISTTADHYHYLAMVSLGAVLALLLQSFLRRFSAYQRTLQLIGWLCLLALFSLASLRVNVWQSDKRLFEDMAKTAPNSYSTAIGMSIVSCLDEGKYDEGVHWTEVALLAQPNDILALANQAFCYLHSKNYFRVTELEFYLNRMDLEQMKTKQPTAYSSLLASIGTAEVELKEYEVGYQYLCAAYSIKPSEPNHLQNLQVATRILQEKGLPTKCDPEFEIAPGKDSSMDSILEDDSAPDDDDTP